MLRQSIRQNLILLYPILAIFVLAGVATGVFLNAYQEWTKSLLERTDTGHRQNLQQIVSIARNTIDPIIKEFKSGKLTHEDAISTIRSLVRTMTYTDEYGQNYVFMSAYDGTMLVQPYEPKMEMTNQLDLKDAQGVYIIQELIRASQAYPEGSFVKYHYYLPGIHAVQEKLAFVVGIPELGCYIGTGMYRQKYIEDQLAILKKVKQGAIWLLLVVIVPIIASVITVLNHNRRLLLEVKYRKEAEEQAQQSSKILTDVVQAASEFSIVSTNPEGLITVFNRGAELLLGYSSSEVIGKLNVVSLHLASEVTTRCQELSEQFGRKVEGFNVFTAIPELNGSETRDWTFVRKDGSTLLVSMVVTPIRAIDNKIIGYLGIATDITRQKELEAKRYELEQRLYQAQKLDAIGQLAGGVAHDFNNILMGIQGAVSLIALNTPIDAAASNRLSLVSELVERGALLTKQLLGFARGGKYEPKVLAVNDLIRKSNQFYLETKKDIKVILELDSDLSLIEADAGQIEQVLLNLYINAGQAMPNGGTITITTSNEILDQQEASRFQLSPGDYVKITVKDSGVGIDEVTIKKIFDPFFSTKTAQGGTGLGLASAYGIIRNHGGIVVAESTVGQGSTFTIFIPATTKQLPVEQAKPSEGPILGNGTILVVDDEPAVLNTTAALLSRLGYSVYKASNGEEALAVYRDKPKVIDLVILDMVMPGMNGSQLLKHLREINPGVKVILSSGYSMQGDVQAAMENQSQDFIQKPYNLSSLSAIVNRVMSSVDKQNK